MAWFSSIDCRQQQQILGAASTGTGLLVKTIWRCLIQIWQPRPPFDQCPNISIAWFSNNNCRQQLQLLAAASTGTKELQLATTLTALCLELKLAMQQLQYGLPAGIALGQRGPLSRRRIAISYVCMEIAMKATAVQPAACIRTKGSLSCRQESYV